MEEKQLRTHSAAQRLVTHSMRDRRASVCHARNEAQPREERPRARGVKSAISMLLLIGSADASVGDFWPPILLVIKVTPLGLRLRALTTDNNASAASTESSGMT